ncbi:unnamed protein product, partial [Brenthis ino]
MRKQIGASPPKNSFSEWLVPSETCSPKSLQEAFGPEYDRAYPAIGIKRSRDSRKNQFVSSKQVGDPFTQLHILRRLVFQSTRHAKGESLSLREGRASAYVINIQVFLQNGGCARKRHTLSIRELPKASVWMAKKGLDRSPYVFVLSSVNKHGIFRVFPPQYQLISAIIRVNYRLPEHHLDSGAACGGSSTSQKSLHGNQKGRSPPLRPVPSSTGGEPSIQAPSMRTQKWSGGPLGHLLQNTILTNSYILPRTSAHQQQIYRASLASLPYHQDEAMQPCEPVSNIARTTTEAPVRPQTLT